MATAITVSIALYHFCEQFPDHIKPDVCQIIQDCSNYKLIQGVANAAKHKVITDLKYKPLVIRSDHISEIIHVVNFHDENGDYWHSQTVIEVKCEDGTTKYLDSAITDVLNYWGKFLSDNNICNYNIRSDPPFIGSVYIARNDATLHLDLSGLSGLDFQHNIRPFKYDAQTGCSILSDLEFRNTVTELG